MKYFADIHIHSRFSVATSKNLVPESLEYWARLKGIHLLGTGDCVHPGWLMELKEKLEPAGNGFFRLKDEFRLRESKELSHENIPEEVFFILTGEISTIYKRDGQVRKVHSLCVFPDYKSVHYIQDKLDRIGNIRSDGRPILGLDTRDLLTMVLESDSKSFLVPAHIWTPWFSVLGSKSGFSSIDECFGDLSGHIFAVETGLSSDPAMNRTCSMLDRFTLVSNSDAHSPEKLGREANVIDACLDYDSFLAALKGHGGFLGTVEFFPQEGKYHYDGHRKCGICWNPLDTELHNGICPKCGKEVTKGVMNRVAELSDREVSVMNPNNCWYITQLPDIIAEMVGQKNSSSKKVMEVYHRLVRSIGSEFFILLDAPCEIMDAQGDGLLAEGIGRLRRNEVIIEEGFDGEFGKILVFDDGRADSHETGGLFKKDTKNKEIGRLKKFSIQFDIARFREMRRKARAPDMFTPPESARTKTYCEPWSGLLADAQRSAVEYRGGPCLVVAGPGTGKTRVLTRRIHYLIHGLGVQPHEILALTFSNRAAGELRERCEGENTIGITVTTLHSFGLSVVRKHHTILNRSERFRIINEKERLALFSEIVNDAKDLKKIRERILSRKNGTGDVEDDELIIRYESICREKDCIDLDDLILMPAKLLEQRKDIAEEYRHHFHHIMVDEFQDINGPQYRMIRSLCGNDGGNLFVIGDPDQAIYGFRGASSHFIDDCIMDFKNLKTFTLNRSYRCPDPVLMSARHVINNKDSIEGVPSDLKIEIIETESSRSEADWLASVIEQNIGGVRNFSMNSGISDGSAEYDGIGFSDFAVLCRSSFMFEEIVEALNNHGVPYQLIDNAPFYTKGHFAEAIDHLKKWYYNNDIEADIESAAFISFRDGATVSEVLGIILEDDRVPGHEIRRITRFSDHYGVDIGKFLHDVELGRGTDDYDARASAVAVMTIHQSKGLEFDTVFIPGCDEGIIPFSLFGQPDNETLSEEERLLYVGMTRSKRRLYLSHAHTRMYHGRSLVLNRSGFLNKFEEKYIHTFERVPAKKKRDDQLSLF